MTTVLIDGDIVSYRCSASVNKQVKELLQQDQSEHSVIEALDIEKQVAILRADQLMREIITATEATYHRCFLTGEGNFRKELYPEYKAHRVQEKPMFLPDVNQFLIDEWDAEIIHGMEADDMLGMTQTHYASYGTIVYAEPASIIASIDKDLLMIPGRHYNFVKREFYDITEFQGYYNFYKSILTGDRTDNIPGVQLGFGPKTAENALMACQTEPELCEVVRGLYNDDERLLRNAQLLWIKRDYSTSLGNTSLEELLKQGQMMKSLESNGH